MKTSSPTRRHRRWGRLHYLFYFPCLSLCLYPSYREIEIYIITICNYIYVYMLLDIFYCVYFKYQEGRIMIIQPSSWKFSNILQQKKRWRCFKSCRSIATHTSPGSVRQINTEFNWRKHRSLSVLELSTQLQPTWHFDLSCQESDQGWSVEF